MIPTNRKKPADERLKTVETAASMNCSIVGLDWLFDCIRRRELLPVTDYLLRKNIPTQIRKYGFRSAGQKRLGDLESEKPVAKVPKIAKEFLEELADDNFPGPGSGKVIPFTLYCIRGLLMSIIHAVPRFIFLFDSMTLS